MQMMYLRAEDYGSIIYSNGQGYATLIPQRINCQNYYLI